MTSRRNVSKKSKRSVSSLAVDSSSLSVTEQLKDALKLNGYRNTATQLKCERWSREDSRQSKSFTFLGAGWVELYHRCYPAKEGWSITKMRVTEALEHHVGF
jgi:hypothetical protein